jgi:hypothetical protein
MSSLRTLGAILYLAVFAAGANPSFNLADGLVDGQSGDDACRDAFSADVACGPELNKFIRTRSMHREGSRPPTDDDLDPFCTDSCYVSLLEYRQAVRSNCGDAVYKEPGTGRPWKPYHRAELALFAYKRRCLKNPSVERLFIYIISFLTNHLLVMANTATSWGRRASPAS